jgi:metal-responsive CopG/Arc/MetJ family transcriptional regulator
MAEKSKKILEENESGKTNILLPIKNELLAKVDEAAKKDNRSRVNFICNLLEKAVE